MERQMEHGVELLLDRSEVEGGFDAGIAKVETVDEVLQCYSMLVNCIPRRREKKKKSRHQAMHSLNVNGKGDRTHNT